MRPAAAAAAAAIESSATWVVWIFYSEWRTSGRASERHPSLRGPFVEKEDYRPIIWISELGRQTPNSEFAVDDTEPKSPFLSRLLILLPGGDGGGGRGGRRRRRRRRRHRHRRRRRRMIMSDSEVSLKAARARARASQLDL